MSALLIDVSSVRIIVAYHLRSKALSYTNLGHLELQLEAHSAASEHLKAALAIYVQLREYGYPTLQTVKGLAQLALGQQDWGSCDKLLKVAERLAARSRIVDIPSRRVSLVELRRRLLQGSEHRFEPEADRGRSISSLLEELSI